MKLLKKEFIYKDGKENVVCMYSYVDFCLVVLNS